MVVQISDVHIGGPNVGAGERFSAAIEAVNAMARQPDLVLITGDLTHRSDPAEWSEFGARLAVLRAPCEVLRGNHDRRIAAHVDNRAFDLGALRFVLLDTSGDEFSASDEVWLERELEAAAAIPTVIALHHPPFETGIWWMDCVGLQGAERFERVVRRHGSVRHVMSGHVHRPIITTWAGTLLTVCPSTSVAVAGDLDPAHDPAETVEPPMIALHTYLADTVVSHVVAVGPAAARTSISSTAPDFVAWAREVQSSRSSEFAENESGRRSP